MDDSALSRSPMKPRKKCGVEFGRAAAAPAVVYNEAYHFLVAERLR